LGYGVDGEESPLVLLPVPEYPKSKYKLKGRKKPLSYLHATQSIQTMFVQQAELWKRQAAELENIANLTEAQVEDRLITESPPKKKRKSQPASSNSKKDKSASKISSQEHLSTYDAPEHAAVEKILGKIDDVQRWRFEREEEEEADNPSNNDGNSDKNSLTSSQRASKKKKVYEV